MYCLSLPFFVGLEIMTLIELELDCKVGEIMFYFLLVKM